MTTHIIDSLQGLEAIAAEWSALHLRCPRATPFQSPQWLLPWTRRLFKGGRILTIAVMDAGMLVGLAPLFCWGTRRRAVSFLGAGVSDYGDLIFAPGVERGCVAAVWRCLADCQESWDAIDLQEVPCGSGLLEGQAAEECSVCPVLGLTTYPESMEPKHRTDLRRARNKLLKEERLQFEMANESTCAQSLSEFFRLHQARWGAMDDSICRFHRDAAREFAAQNQLWLALLRIDGPAAAAVYAFRTGSTLYCYLSAFDPALAKLSPGAVLLGWVIERALAEGITAVDFLRNAESYKYLWGARDSFNYKLSSLPPVALHAGK